MELIYDAGFWSVCHGCKSQNGAVNGVELILDCKSVITRHPLYKLCVMMHSIHYHRCPSYL